MNLDQITCPKRSERLVRLHRITNKWNWHLQHPRHFLQCLSTILLMFGHRTLLQRRSFVFTIPWCPSWASSDTHKLAGMTICIPLITNLPTTVIYLSIYLVVIACGIAFKTVTIVTYASVTPSQGEADTFVIWLRQSAMFWPEGTWCTVYLKGIRRRTHLLTQADGLNLGPWIASRALQVVTSWNDCSPPC